MRKVYRIDNITEEGLIRGYITKFNEIDSYNSLTVKGAFSQTLEQVKQGRVIPFLWQHDQREPIGKFLSFEETSEGIIGTCLLDLNVQKAQEAYSLVKNGIITGLSIGARVLSSDYENYDDKIVEVLKDLELFEVSLVTFPACDGARIDEVRAKGVKMTNKARQIEMALKATGLLSNNICKQYANILAKKSDEKEELEDEIEKLVKLDDDDQLTDDNTEEQENDKVDTSEDTNADEDEEKAPLREGDNKLPDDEELNKEEEDSEYIEKKQLLHFLKNFKL